ncbi:MAG TPA: hypothetical protein PK971_04350, partial [Saprospiraceae bacterium]|nr:hypothetical protein [Saprospiraceae bacterium]
EGDDAEGIVQVLAQLYGENPSRDYLPYFEQKLGKVDYMSAFAFFDNYQKVLAGLNDAATTEAGISRLKAVSLDSKTSLFRRFGATKALADLRKEMEGKGNTAQAEALTKIIEEIKEQEKDSTLKMYYGMF